MTITLYKTTSNPKSLTKTLENASACTGAIIRDSGGVDILRPRLRVNQSISLDSYNYLKIDELGRYYFIRDARIDRTGISELECTCDVLASHSAEIKDCDAVFDRTANADAANTDIPDSMIRVTAGHYIDYYNFDNGLVYPERIIMVCNV